MQLHAVHTFQATITCLYQLLSCSCNPCCEVAEPCQQSVLCCLTLDRLHAALLSTIFCSLQPCRNLAEDCQKLGMASLRGDDAIRVQAAVVAAKEAGVQLALVRLGFWRLIKLKKQRHEPGTYTKAIGGCISLLTTAFVLEGSGMVEVIHVVLCFYWSCPINRRNPGY